MKPDIALLPLSLIVQSELTVLVSFNGIIGVTTESPSEITTTYISKKMLIAFLWTGWLITALINSYELFHCNFLIEYLVVTIYQDVQILR